MADAETEARLKRIETTLDRLAAKLTELEARIGSPGQETEVVKVLRQRVDTVTGERDTLAQSVSRLQATRARPTADQIGQSFAGAADKLRQGIGGSFAVSDMSVEMKSQLAVEADGSLRFVLPHPGETIAADTLSTVRFNLRAAPPATTPPAPDAPLITVPTLVGLSRDSALLLLTRAGLKAGSTTEIAARARPGTVIAQDPLPGDEIAAEIAVDLTLAAPPPVEVPDLSGQDAEEAKKRLADAGLAVGKLADAPEGTRGTPGTVAGQSVKPGTEVAPGTTIDLLLVPPPPPPRPSPTVRVPDLVGRTAGEASGQLSDAGLSAGPARRIASSQPNGTVLSTSPAAGAELPRGAPVAMTLARQTEIDPLLERIRVRGAATVTPAAPAPPAAPTAPGVAPGARRVAAPTPPAPPASPLASNRIVDQLRALQLSKPEDLRALIEEPDAVLATKLALPTPRDAVAARALIRSVLEE
jgi:beta-lactam-binding protein with PASTA domain